MQGYRVLRRPLLLNNMPKAKGGSKQVVIYQFRKNGAITVHATTIKGGEFVQKDNYSYGSFKNKASAEQIGRAVLDALSQSDYGEAITE